MSYSKKYCTDQQVIEAAKEPTMARAAIKCGLHVQTFKRRALELDVYAPNQGSKGVKHGHYKSRIPTQEILEGIHPQFQTYKLRCRLIEENILKYECDICHINDHMGKTISLELDHIDGIRYNHKLDNLRLLCPNCHSQTKTYRSKKR
jgi:5-methylcytosine-specific restriction endonuclease McrA